jgi:hypothetical protein
MLLGMSLVAESGCSDPLKRESDEQAVLASELVYKSRFRTPRLFKSYEFTLKD